jgi:nucleotide-binding universal stress UspA family protein
MKNILVPIDFSPVTPAVIRAAGRLAREHQARIVLLSVGRRPEAPKDPAAEGEDFDLLDRGKIGLKLAEYGASLNAEGVETEPFERFGPPADCIVEEARRISADYIVMGAHGHGSLLEALVGSTTGGVLRHAPCPVVVVPALRQNSPATD